MLLWLSPEADLVTTGKRVLVPWVAPAILFRYDNRLCISMEVLPLFGLLGVDTFVQMFLGNRVVRADADQRGDL